MTKEVEPAVAKCFQGGFTNRVPSGGPLKLEKTKNKFTVTNTGNLRSWINYLVQVGATEITENDKFSQE